MFHSKERALEAAEEYGRSKDVLKVGELYLEGTFGVIMFDEGDLQFDGPTAKFFFEACKKRGLLLNRKYARTIDASDSVTHYSCRKLLGDIDYNRDIVLGQGKEEDEDTTDEFWSSFEGECQGCDSYLPLNDLGLCDECAQKLDRDLIRQRDWEYSSLAFGVPIEQREALRQRVIRQFGDSYELISPPKAKKKKQPTRSKKKSKRKQR
ncbi:MAG: hypothetical protein ACE5JB_05855 [bacterium]